MLTYFTCEYSVLTFKGCFFVTCTTKIEELGVQGMVDEAQSLMTQVEELEKQKNSYSARTGSRVCKYEQTM